MRSKDPNQLTRRWATFASEIGYRDLPADLVQTLKCLVLDTIGVAIAASTLGDCCENVARLLSSNPGPPQCTVLGFGIRTSALLGGFANGALAHALNFDALGASGGHVALAAVPAPLAMAERTGGISGEEFLASVAVAAELTARLAASLAEAKADASEKFLEGQVLGYFGAAVGAGRVLRFSPDLMQSVLGLALMQAAGTRQLSFEGSAAKAIYGAFPNHGAMLSALMAEQGIDGRCAALEGPSGLFKLFYGGRYRASVLEEPLGKEFLAQDMLFKPWATSSVLLPFIRACLNIRDELQLDHREIVRIHLQVSRAALPWLEPAVERRRPVNAATAANSVYFGVAKALANGDVRLNDFTSNGLSQEGALRLCDLTEYSLSESNQDIVEVVLSDGRISSKPANNYRAPISFEELTVKFRDCVRYSANPIAPSATEELIERLANLERETDVGKLVMVAGGLAV